MANQRKRSRKSQARTQGGKKEEGSKKPRLSSDGAKLLSYREHNTRLINFTEDGETWYQYLQKTLQDRTSDISKAINKKSKGGISATELAASYRKQADEVYRREIQIFSGSSDEKWIDSTIRKGTLKDRIAAMSVIVSQDAVHKFHALDGLLQLAGGSSDFGGQANSRVAQLAAEALEDLFLNTLLPPDRKLQTLEQRPLPALDSGKSVTLSPRILLLWRYEEMLKEKYDSFINNYLSQTLREGLEITKIAALKTAAALLRAVPEGEAKILDLIVNKLGDPQKKTAAAAGHELRAVLRDHPNMQSVIAREVQQLAHRPHLSPRALYNCVAFLNQLKLERQGSNQKENLPAALITTYFKLFEVATRSSAERGINNEVSEKSRLLQALLVGVNRAHPYLPTKDQNMDDHINELYRVVHTAPAGAATQALTLLFHIAVGSPLSKGDGDQSNSFAPSEESRVRAERYYRALFAALSGTDLLSHGKHSTMFFNVLYKSMKFDNDPKRVVAFAKRLLSTAVHCSAPTFAASIFVLNEVAHRHEELRVYLEETPEKDSYKTILHPSKRDPRVAFAMHEDESAAGDRLASADTAIASPPSSWELALASHHYHPSVSKFANNVGSIKYHGDPMQDFSLAPFLDKFAYRNPRAVKELNKTAGGGAGQRRTLRKDSMDSRLALPVNDPSFLKRKDTHVHDDFFRKFFLERASRIEISGSKKKKHEAVDEDAALDLAESNVFDDFSALEQNWESDSEEEAFVDSLAQNLLVEKAGGAPVDIDSDPDMDDWGDLYDDSDGEGDEGQFVEADDDQFMEADSDSDSSAG